MAPNFFHFGSGNALSCFAQFLRIIVAVALVVTGCTSREAHLVLTNFEEAADSEDGPQLILPEGVELGPDTVISSPKPKEQRQATRLDADPATDFVRFRFDVDTAGKVSNVRVIRTSKESLANEAKSVLASWEFEPALVDDKPAEMRNLEAAMDFFEKENKAGSTVAKGALLVVLIPLMVIVGVGPSAGSVNFGN